MKKKLLFCGGGILGSVGILLGILFFLLWNGIILLNNPSMTEYPVRGVDVSSYQGEIDWKTLSSQNLSFAFINVITGPSLSDNRQWTFWQYTNREQLTGYRGKEKYIDMNVFSGTPEEFSAYGK